MGTVIQLSVSQGGVPKLAVDSAEVTATGVVGDAQRDTRTHGGPERAVCIYSADLIAALRAEGHPIAPGAVGENVTVEGIEWEAVTPEARLEFEGGVVLEVASYTTPCSAIRGSFLQGQIARINQNERPGWSRVYARVLKPGRIRVGDRVEIIVGPGA